MSLVLYRQPAKGVTIVELIITIVILSVALLGVVSVYSKAIERSANPLIYARSIELGQTFMDEILTKKYDELTPVGGIPIASAVTPSGSLGDDTGETSRSLYDDVDDYHGDTYTTVELITGDNDLLDQYVNFSVSVQVGYVDVSSELSGLGLPASNEGVKRIDVVVSNPLSNSLTFTAYKGNF